MRKTPSSEARPSAVERLTEELRLPLNATKTRCGPVPE